MIQHFINMFNMLTEAHLEEFRLQILTWSHNWHAGIREGSTWMMVQLLAKVDLEYTRLKNLGRWQSSNPSNGSTVQNATQGRVHGIKPTPLLSMTHPRVDTRKAPRNNQRNHPLALVSKQTWQQVAMSTSWIFSKAEGYIHAPPQPPLEPNTRHDTYRPQITPVDCQICH